MFYSFAKIDNYKFATYYLYYKKKLKITESIYYPNFFYKFNVLEIEKIIINKILILNNRVFTNNKKEAIIVAKIITNNYGNFLALDHNINSAGRKNIIKTNLLPKEKYII